MQLSQLARTMGGSAIRAMYNEALKMTNTVSFTLGEPDFVTPQVVIDEACDAWQKGLTHYTPNAGIPELRRAIADYHKDDLKPDFQSEILVSCGAVESLQLALLALVDPGDEVIMITPAYANYFGLVAMCGAVLKEVCVNEETEFVPTVDQMREAITPTTKLVIINSPSNPTGAVIDAETAKGLAKLFVEKDLFVISDEIYSRLVYDDLKFTSIVSFPGMRERTVYVSGFSKMFAMTGWRLGYSIANHEIIRAMTKLHENSASCLPAPTQLAGAKALRDCQGEVDRMRDIYERRRNLIFDLVSDMPGLKVSRPKGAFYLFVSIKDTGMKSQEFCMDLLQKTGVVTVPGTGFGKAGEGYIRLSYATSEDNIKEGMRRMRKYLVDRMG